MRRAASASFLIFAACGDPGRAEKIPEGNAHFEVAFGSASAETGRIVGWNLGRGTYYAPEGDAPHPEWRTAERTAAIARLAEIRMPGGPKPYVRFSGLQIDGAVGGDGYHFWDFVRPDRTLSSTDNMAVFEYDAIAAELDGELLVTLNFGSGTAAEAAEYATYLNGTDATDPIVAARLASSHPAPYGVHVFEIGNETYGAWNTGAIDSGPYSYANPASLNGGDPAWFGRPSSSAADFAGRALEYVSAVLAVDPEARFRVPLSQASMDAWGGLDAALTDLTPLLVHPEVDAVVVHVYKAEDGKTLGVTDINAPDFMLMGSELFRPLFQELRDKLDALPRSIRLGVAVTEYHVADGFSRGTFGLGTTAAVGLGLADMLVFLAHTRVDHACQHLSLWSGGNQDPLVEPHYNPVPGDGSGGVREMPSYTVTRLFADHLLPREATVKEVRMPASTFALTDRSVGYGLVKLAAFASEDGRSGTVFALNRNAEAAETVTLDLEEGFAARDAQEWAPPSFDEDASTTGIPVTGASFRQAGRRVEIIAPPHAVITLRAERP